MANPLTMYVPSATDKMHPDKPPQFPTGLLMAMLRYAIRVMVPFVRLGHTKELRLY